MEQQDGGDDSMKTCIKQFDSAKEYYFDEGCFINEMSNSGDDPELSVVRARVAPGVTTRWHRLHGVSERYVILQGQGHVEVEGVPPTTVGEGGVVIIPAGAAQRISNPGSDDLVFLALCVPPFTAEAYEDIEP